MRKRGRLSPGWAFVHYFLIFLFVSQMIYAMHQVFVVHGVGGWNPVLLGRATEISQEQFMARRMYAIEGWLAMVGLSLYLALTEVLPRVLGVVAAQAADTAQSMQGLDNREPAAAPSLAEPAGT